MLFLFKSYAIGLQTQCYCTAKVMQLQAKNIAFAT